jgi:hypothetical protein
MSISSLVKLHPTSNQITVSNNKSMPLVEIPENSRPTHCPSTRKVLSNTEELIFTSFGDNIVWWPCSVCQGWHVMMLEPASVQGINHNASFNFCNNFSTSAMVL